MQEDQSPPISDSQEGPPLSAQAQLAQIMDQIVDNLAWMVEHEEDLIRIMGRMGELYKRMAQEMNQWSFQRQLLYFKRCKITFQGIQSNFELMASLGSIAARNSLPGITQTIKNAGYIIQMLELIILKQQEELKQKEQVLNNIVEERRQVHMNIKEMNEQLHDLQGNLRVILKIRPIQSQKVMSEKEMDDMRKNVMVRWRSICQIDLFETTPGIIPKKKWVPYRVDQVFSPNIRQEEVFRSVAYLVHKMFKHEKCALLCLGQAGSGNTYTMLGSIQCMELPFLTQDSGIVPRALQEAFAIMEKERKKGRNFHLAIYFREYCMNTSKKEGSKLKFSKPSLVVTQEEPFLLESLKDALIVLGLRMRRRKVCRTEKNQVSSLSHMFICLQLREGPEMKEIGQLCLIDLAGDDKMSEQHPQDSIYINSSLLELRECLKLSKKKAPNVWRGSLIVDSLKSDLEGHKSLLIVNLSSKKENQQHNKTSMNFALDIMNIDQ